MHTPPFHSCGVLCIFDASALHTVSHAPALVKRGYAPQVVPSFIRPGWDQCTSHVSLLSSAVHLRWSHPGMHQRNEMVRRTKRGCIEEKWNGEVVGRTVQSADASSSPEVLVPSFARRDEQRTKNRRVMQYTSPPFHFEDAS